jgi:transcriptional regulator with GAF, ATPase, and Fis domain
METGTLNAILDAVNHVAGADLVAVFTRADPDHLQVRGLRGRLARPDMEGMRVDLRPRPRLAAALDGESPRLLDHEHGDEEDEHEPDTFSEVLTLPGDHSCLAVPLRGDSGVVGLLTLDAVACDAFSDDQMRAIGALAGLAARAVDSERRADDLGLDLARLSARFAAEAVSGPPGARLVGGAPSWREAVERARLVAPTPTSVLITGETGSGKEQVARAIHGWSPRADGPFVALNCSVLVADLALSELFGHDKGAFTGADRRRRGRFELARGGTLFLDEIGDLPAPAQAQLLRVIQERTFERVGGSEPLEADVRLIAATHRDLADDVAAGRFREDLLYRVAAFPIELPPLRDRPGDVALLADHVIRGVRERLEMPELSISDRTLTLLERHAWPGNVRELSNRLERAAILAGGGRIAPRHLDLPDVHTRHAPAGRPAAAAAASPESRLPPSLNRLERAMAREILAALAESGGKVSGAGGAAELLGLKPTTLHSTIKRLGLRGTGPTRDRSDLPG